MGAGGLRETLAEVAERVERYRGSRIGEQNTKAALIVPVLRALGWDLEDLDEIHLEYRLKPGDRPVDYALMLQREAVLFIEAKALDEDLADRRWAKQIVGYAMEAGVEWVVLTNGDEYRIYNSHALVPFEDKLFRSVRVTGDIGEAADALRLLTKDELRGKSLAALWRAQSVDNRVRQAVEDLFQPEPSQWLVRRLANSIDGLTQGDIRAALSRARISLDFPAAEPGTSAAPLLPSERPAPAAPPVVASPGEKKPAPAAPSARRPAARYDVTVKDLLDAGLIQPGARLRQRYLGQDVSAMVEPDGRVRFGDEVYKSLSIAAGEARVAVKGPPQDGRKRWQTNGWTFWEYEDEGGKTRPLEALREQYLRERATSLS
jgi:hypothetical protein